MGWLEFISNIVRALAWPVAVILGLLLFRVQLRELLVVLKVRFNKLSEISGPGFNAKFAAEARDAAQVLEQVSVVEKMAVDQNHENKSLGRPDKAVPAPSDSQVSRAPHEGEPPPRTDGDDKVSSPSSTQLPSHDERRDSRWMRQRANELAFERMRQTSNVSPSGAVLEAFVILERSLAEVYDLAVTGGGVGDERLRELHRLGERNSPRGMVSALSRPNAGWPVLPDDFSRAVDSLIRLRNEAVHQRDSPLSPESARNYVDAVESAVNTLSDYTDLVMDTVLFGPYGRRDSPAS